MDPLARADKKAASYGLAGTLALTIGGAFWALPHIEDELDEESLGVASYSSAEGYEVEWNGRDGYLTVPAGTPRAEAEIVAADLAGISGTRDVEIQFRNDAGAADEPVAETPSSFEVTWGPDGRTASGSVPGDLESSLNTAFDVDGLAGADDRTMSDATEATLRDVVAPVVGNEIAEGRLTVDGDRITLTGVVADEATRERLAATLSAVSGVEDVDLTVAEAPSEPADFIVNWDDTGANQQGLAPTDLDAALRGLGVGSPDTADRLVVDDGVSADLATLAPLVGSTLTSGSAEVIDGALTIRGNAATQEQLETAQATLAGTDASIELELVPTTQADFDALALQGLEFETNTDVLTAETEAIIDVIAAVLDANPGLEIEIIGHTDSRGADDLNQQLSEARAQAVVNGLEARGIDADRLTAIGRGESEPVDSNDTVEGRQNNRRVDIKIKEYN